MFAKRARPLVKQIYLNLEFKFRITVTVMKGPYLPITWKRKTIFFSMTKNNKKMYILRKESNDFLNIPISWHFNEHARYLALYFNESKLSIHVGNS